jgi:hypothetical protein
MILVGDRSAEERHDSVTHHLVDGALVAMNRLHHQFEHGVEDLACLLGVTVGEQLHRALEVGEENGDLLALSFQRLPGREDLLGQVLRCVSLRRSEARYRRRRSRCQCCAATIAEFAPGLDLCPAARANRRECRATLTTETGAVAVICLAPKTPHPSLQ